MKIYKINKMYNTNYNFKVQISKTSYNCKNKKLTKEIL